MGSGLGPNFILPLAGWMSKNFTGQDIDPHHPIQNLNWFGPDPMGGVSDAMQRGRAGFWQASGPQSSQYQPDYFHGGNTPPVSYGTNAALYGGSFDPKLGQGAYDRFADAGASYNRRFSTNLAVDAKGNIQQPFLDAQGNQVGYGQGGVKPNPGYSDPANQKALSPEAGAGERTYQQFGGRDQAGNPLVGSQYDTSKTMAGLMQLQQNANPFLMDPTQAAKMSQYQELNSPFARADPQAYMKLAMQANNSMPSTRNQMFGDATKVQQAAQGFVDPISQLAQGGVDKTFQAGTPDIYEMALRQAGLAQGGIDYTKGMTNQFQDQLMDQIAQQGSKDLSLGLQDAQGTMAAMGLGRSGQAQSTAGGIWNDIQQQNSLQRNQLLGQFAESAMNRQAQTSDLLRNTEMGQVGNAIMGRQGGTLQAALAAQGAGTQAGLNAQQGTLQALLAAQQQGGASNEAALQRIYGSGMQGMDALTGSLEGSRAREAGNLGQGFQNTLAWNQGTQGNFLNALQSGDQSALNRMIAQSNSQSQGLHDYMGLQQYKDQMYNDRLNQMMGIEDRSTNQQQAILDQQRMFSMMPYDAMMTMLTGIQPTQMQSRQSVWPGIIGQAGMGYGNTLLQNSGQVSSPYIGSTSNSADPWMSGV